MKKSKFYKGDTDMRIYSPTGKIYAYSDKTANIPKDVSSYLHKVLKDLGVEYE